MHLNKKFTGFFQGLALRSYVQTIKTRSTNLFIKYATFIYYKPFVIIYFAHKGQSLVLFSLIYCHNIPILQKCQIAINIAAVITQHKNLEKSITDLQIPLD